MVVPGMSVEEIQTSVDSAKWYHTIELAPGVVTPGYYDLRSVLSKIPMPASLAGMRCLDLACCQGFWSFEMERRGASEVVAIDLDEPADMDYQGARPPAGKELGSIEGFEIARRALGSKVDRRNVSIYDLSPDLVGTFDFAFIGNVLIHLADPARALRAIGKVVAGKLLSVELVSLHQSLLHPRLPAGMMWDLDDPRWWTPNLACYRRWFRAAEYEILETGPILFQQFGSGFAQRPPLHRFPRLNLREVAFWLTVHPIGAPSSYVVATPRREK